MADPHERHSDRASQTRPDLYIVAKDGVEVTENAVEFPRRIVKNQAHYPLEQLREYGAVHPIDSGTVVDFSCEGESCAVSFSSQIRQDDAEKKLPMSRAEAQELFAQMPSNGNFEQGVRNVITGGDLVVWNLKAGQPAGIEIVPRAQASTVRLQPS